MILIDKRVGETPLQLINRIRIEMPKLKNERLSYAGRLDPMAEGQMLILVGDENNNRDKYLGLDKDEIKDIKVNSSRWVSILKTYPKIVLSEKLVYTL
jgi:hypothetical protein